MNPVPAPALLALSTAAPAWATGDTVLQLHGVGPWSITCVDPADDPRAKK